MAVIDSAVLVLRANRYSGSGDWLDESAGGHDASVLVGAPTFDTDHWVFDGDDQFSVANHDDLNFAAEEDFTVVVVATRTDHATFDGLFDKASFTPTIGYRLFGLQAETVRAVTGSDSTETWASHAWADDAVTVLAVTREGLALTVSVGGETASDNEPSGGRDLTNTEVLRIGGIDGFIGDIYGVAVWRSALTAQQIADAGDELVEPAGPTAAQRLLLLGA